MIGEIGVGSRPYFTIRHMLSMIDLPNRTGCEAMYHDHVVEFRRAHGATDNHQAWPGGYHDHVREVMNIAIVLYELYSKIRTLPFSLPDALLVLYLHDVEKPWRWKWEENVSRLVEMLGGKEAHDQFRANKLKEYNILLTPYQENGLKYVEGEGADYSGTRRVMNPLAAFCHVCDVTSARIWFDHPASTDDQWSGAIRCSRE